MTHRITGIRTALAALAVAAVTTLPRAADAQADPGTGALRGRVTAPDDQAVPGATVIVDAAGEPRRGAVADANGVYLVSPLPAGTYTVRVRALGHAEAAPRTVQLAAGQMVTLDIVLQPTATRLAEQVVTATRSAAAARDVAASVTVVTRDQLDAQVATAPGLADALGKLVPGLGAGLGGSSTYGQNLRGRNIAVLVDGVPLSTSRNVLRDLNTIDPAAVERIEVLRGASAIYGDGATGGVINIVTRGAVAGATRFSTELAAQASLRDIGRSGGARATQTAAGSRGPLDFLLSATRASTGLVVDGDGDLAPPDPNGQGGVADSDVWNLFAKTGVQLGAQRLQLTVNHFDNEQATEYATLATADTTGKAQLRRGLVLETPQAARNTIVSLDLTRDAVLGGRAHGQLYWRDYLTRFAPFVFNVRRPSTGSTARQPFVTQSFVDSEKWGGRLEFLTPLTMGGAATITWGADYVSERTSQGLNVFDRAAYEDSEGLVFRRRDQWTWIPPMDVRSAAAFAQFAWRPLERLALNGGVRHERARISVGDFVTVEENAITGGTMRFTPTLFNAGAVLTVGGGVDLVASFSQGFSLADVGRVLRGAPAGFSLGDRTTDAQRVDQWEAGARGSWSRAQATLTWFRNSSDLGTRLDANLNVLRAPERVYGVEGTLDVQPTARLALGLAGGWNEGDYLDRSAERWRPLDGYRISPWKVSAYAQHRTLPRWTNRVQLLHSGSRDRAARDGASYGGRPVDGYTLVDLFSTVRVGPGELTVGVENMLDRLYFPPTSQLLLSNTAATRSAGRGATLSLGYTVSY